MSAADFNLGVECILNQAICAMREVYASTSSYPPLGGGSSDIRVFAGDAPPMGAVDLHINDCACAQPFLWVRLMRRYRTHDFPAPYVGPNGCSTQIAIAVELGVGRCAVMSAEAPSWKELSEEAEISLDDSGRIEFALCRASALMQQKRCSDMQAFDAVSPFGPEGGVIGWTGTLYAAVST